MKKRIGKILSLVLVLAMVFSLLPGQASAALISGEQFTVRVVKVVNGNEADSVTLTQKCLQSTGHSGYNHSTNLRTLANLSGFTGYKGYNWSSYTTVPSTYKSGLAPNNNYAPVHYNITGSAPYKANETLFLFFETSKTFTLKYNANGGSNAPDQQTATSASDSYTFTISSQEPTREGYDFQGWSTSSTATSPEYSVGGNIEVTGTTTLYAVWEQINQTKPDGPIHEDDGELTITKKFVGLTADQVPENFYLTYEAKSKGNGLYSDSGKIELTRSDDGLTFTGVIKLPHWVYNDVSGIGFNSTDDVSEDDYRTIVTITEHNAAVDGYSQKITLQYPGDGSVNDNVITTSSIGAATTGTGRTITNTYTKNSNPGPGESQNPGPGESQNPGPGESQNPGPGESGKPGESEKPIPTLPVVPEIIVTPTPSQEPTPSQNPTPSQDPTPVESEEPTPVESEEPTPVESEEPGPSQEPTPVESEEPTPVESDDPAEQPSEDPGEEIEDPDTPMGELPDLPDGSEEPGEPDEDFGDSDIPMGELPGEPGGPGEDPAQPGDPAQDGEPDEDIDDGMPPMGDVPQTGDNLAIWLAAAAVSGIGLVGVIGSTRKRKESEEA